MSQALQGKKVAILIADGFEQIEMTQPRQAFALAGANTELISLAGEQVQGCNFNYPGDYFQVDIDLNQANPEDYDALLLPGGDVSCEQLKSSSQATKFVKAFFAAEKPVAAICHGAWTLIEADVARGRKLTSSSALETESTKAGATWVDESIVVDHNLVTSRNCDDLPWFINGAISVFSSHQTRLQPA